METVRKYQQELLLLLGGPDISDEDGRTIVTCIHNYGVSTGSDGSMKDDIGGHAFLIPDNSITNAIWVYAKTVWTQREMTSLMAEHGGALGMLPVLYDMYICYQE